MADDEEQPAVSVCTFLSGIATFCFLIWLCWIVTELVRAGIPEAQRAELVSTGMWVASGVAVSAILAAKSVSVNPLQFVASWITAVKGMIVK